MAQLGDLFQKFMSIPKEIGTDRDAQNTWRKLSSILDDLDTIGAHVPGPGGAGVALVPSARNEYLNMLSMRGKHLLAKATAFVDGLGENPPFINVTPPNDQELRDFYHNIYYSAFYAGRYILVSEGHFDDSEHKNVPQALQLLANRIQSTDTVKFSLLKETEQCLQELKNYRSKADYVMNTQELSLLATPATVLEAKSKVTQLYSSWGL